MRGILLFALSLALNPTAAEAGEVIAWGDNYDGQCNVPAEAQSGTTAIAGGYWHSVVLTGAGEVIAWGYNGYGQCNVPPAAQSGVTAIAAGGEHSLALTGAGEVIAWGDNYYGQCDVPAEAQSGVIAIGGGGYHTLVLTEAGEVIAWGDNSLGQCDVPADLPTIIAIASGWVHNLALTADGEVIAWGDNSDGQCDVLLEAQSGVIAIAGGWDHSLALTEAGEVIAWGDDGDGQCTVPIAAQSSVIAVAGGGAHSLALTEAGQVIAWGKNNCCQCNVPAEAQSGTTAIAAGRWHTLALLPPAPEADFSGSPTSGTAPLTVSFSDLSTNSPTAWQWEFGDGGTSTERNPSYSYLLAGIYTPSMTASTAWRSDTETKKQYIWVGFLDCGPDNWAFEETLLCVDADIVQGYPGGYYQPTWAVNRGQMAVYIARAIAGGDSSVPDAVAPATFDDVSDTNSTWAWKYVEYAVAQNVVQGYDENTYAPEVEVDRGQMAVFIARGKGWVILGDDMATAPELFPDVPAGHWAGKAIGACVDHNVVQGYGDGYYRPYHTVTREQMAVYVARAFNL